jgi:hypothetical protein
VFRNNKVKWPVQYSQNLTKNVKEWPIKIIILHDVTKIVYKDRLLICNTIQLMTFHKVDTVIYQSRGSDVPEANGWGEHHFQGVDKSVSTEMKSSIVLLNDTF